MTQPAFYVRTARWPDDEAALYAVRREVFVVEQHVPETLEWDGRDAQCRHAIALDMHGLVIGCGRLVPDGHIGRMAVSKPWRGRGVGRALLDALVAMARAAGHRAVELHAQSHAVPFYERAGFVRVGPPFIEAGIPHETMRRTLTDAAER